MVECRCPFCGMLVCKAQVNSTVQAKCPRKKCSSIVQFTIQSDESVEHTVTVEPKSNRE